ncbi:hypothetical protein CIL05_20700 [Virgibacillus profundi]|uniref:Uncharacterized protein n=1 Tax=Virgibacillus profundi TaxID=2024555 RepID=A0A2A2I8R1_9BACI|nr:hypothetical protein [Virgibacillus profundi]PAV27674.1 hypothetical protein CIL05_20700 [Virgibacillus profundi]PXY51829.1 hypothetical protein CIT14_20920 [Virgibacillus profundi]
MQADLIDDFINCLKMLNHRNAVVNLPLLGEYKRLEANSSNYSFVIDINRRGRQGYLTLQLRNLNFQDKPITRLDISGPSHKNPEGDFELSGQIIPCPHIHIAKEGYGDSIAYPLDHHNIKLHLTNEALHDLVIILRKFLEFINIGNLNDFEFYHQNQLNLT